MLQSEGPAMPRSMPTLVAETDAAGQVAHVWVTMPGWRHARPVKRGAIPGGLRLDQAECHGASRQDIADWLTRNAEIAREMAGVNGSAAD